MAEDHWRHRLSDDGLYSKELYATRAKLKDDANKKREETTQASAFDRSSHASLQLLKRQIDLTRQGTQLKDDVTRRTLRRVQADHSVDTDFRSAHQSHGSRLLSEAESIIGRANDISQVFRGTGHRLDANRRAANALGREAELWSASAAAIRGVDLGLARTENLEALGHHRKKTLDTFKRIGEVDASFSKFNPVASLEADEAEDEEDADLGFITSTDAPKEATKLQEEFSTGFGRSEALGGWEKAEALKTVDETEGRIDVLRASLGFRKRVEAKRLETEQVKEKAAEAQANAFALRLRQQTVGRNMNFAARARLNDLLQKAMVDAERLAEVAKVHEAELLRLKRWEEKWEETKDFQVLEEERKETLELQQEAKERAASAEANEAKQRSHQTSSDAEEGVKGKEKLEDVVDDLDQFGVEYKDEFYKVLPFSCFPLHCFVNIPLACSARVFMKAAFKPGSKTRRKRINERKSDVKLRKHRKPQSQQPWMNRKRRCKH